MKILFFLNNDIHAWRALQMICPQIKKHKIKIILSQNVGKESELPLEILEMKKLEKLGVEELSQKLAQDLDAEIIAFDNVNSEKSLRELKNFSADLAVSIRFGQIFKADFIALFPAGVLNLHSGILPKYRGIMASFWAILNKEKNLGTTLHYVRNAEIDTGDIVGFSESKINWQQTLLENIAEIYQGGCELLLQALEKISAGEKLPTTDQRNLGEGGYFSYPKSKDVDEFLKLMRIL